MTRDAYNDAEGIYVCWLSNTALEECLGATPVLVAYETSDIPTIRQVSYVVEIGELHLIKHHLIPIVVVIDHDVVSLDVY